MSARGTLSRAGERGPTTGGARPGSEAATGASGREEESLGAPALGLLSVLLGGSIQVEPPDPVAPCWREQDGTRHSYSDLRSGLDGEAGRELRQAHLEAIRRIAAAALEALDRGDQRETARLAMAAGRLCEEIAGRWTPAAVEVPRR